MQAQSAKPTNDSHYDLILIGSGMGALTVASLMSQLRGKRVLVLERHFKAGGFTHDFKRHQFHWDVGIHYIGQMNEGSSMRQLFDLVTQNGVQWSKMPEPFERFVYPGLTFDVYGDPKRFQADLIHQFPAEKRAIRRYFRDLRKAAAALFLRNLRLNGNWLSKLIGQLGSWWSGIGLDLTTQEYLDRHFSDPKLKALLVSQWGDYGLPPAQSPFAVHATIATHYLHGAYYPVGGAGAIAHSVKTVVESRGGRFLLNRDVTQVLIENGRAVGVQVRKVNAAPEAELETYYAPIIVSNTGAATTYLKLIPADYPIPFRDSLRQFVQRHSSITNVTLYLGLADDPRKLGFLGENHWLYEAIDHNAIYEKRSQWIFDGEAPQCYLSFPSLKDPKATAHTAEILAWADYDSFAQWKAQPWLHRGQDYQQLKERISQTLIQQVDRQYPGFAKLVAYYELSTPLTNEHFTGHNKGGIYGLPAIAERFAPENAAWTKTQTPVPGLYLTGADLYMGGIVSAMLAGVTTVNSLPGGVALPKVFAIAAKETNITPPLPKDSRKQVPHLSA
ncbi:NAD(P)/FAD-dependent oxidoreductase [Oscillatoria sp. FACHB-1407]|uniref:phytoene desaturase family protein n=1 Tax=Oscillatoria sp. FACHB-1407 TaxID=2692847 RepID=UPI001688B048|nr:NAD(P)/FAD-dependent oxidoreductase [Oscillatoria sp. FACHB-1407]MBD2463735.1 NAD(P)/FAD-dependent oxidoreductase [Oscillatoria sp. FACHB-1407]